MQNVLPSINALLIACNELIFIIYFSLSFEIYIYSWNKSQGLPYFSIQGLPWNKSQGLPYFIWLVLKKRIIQSKSNVEKLVHAFVILRMDYFLLSYCFKNSLHSLQLIQNVTVSILTRSIKRPHISPVLAAHHWLNVRYKTEFKIPRVS